MKKYFKELEKWYFCKIVWKNLNLEYYVNRKKFYDIPEKAGIYVVRTNVDILYIGCTNNLKQRLYNHRLLSSLNKESDFKNKLKISFCLLTGTGSLIAPYRIEYNMIDMCSPKYNERKSSKEPNKESIKQFIDFFENVPYLPKHQPSNSSLIRF